MPRFLSRQNAVLTDEQHYATKQNQVQVSQDKERNTKIDTTNTKLDDLKNQQDGVIGAINNTTIGDGTLGHRTYVYAHDTTNGVARALKCDSSGRLEASVDALEITAETINLSTDTLEAKTQAITDKLDSFAGAGNNNVGEGSAKLQTYLYGRDVAAGNFKPLVCDGDAHLQVDVLSTALPTGGATEATLLAAKNALFTDPAGTGNTAGENLSALNSNLITTNSKIDTTNSKLTTIDTSATAIDIAIGGLRNDLTQNGLGGGNKAGVMLEAQNTNLIAISNKMVGGQTTSGMATAANQQVVDLTLQGIDTILGNIETDAAALEVLQTSTNTKLDTIDGVLDNIKLDTAAIKTAVEILDNVVSGSEAQVDVVSLPALPTGSNTIGTVNLSATDNAVLDAIATDGDNIQTKLDTLITSNAAIKTAVEILDNVVSGSEAQVDVVSLPALPTGSNTIGTVNLSATDNAVLDAIATDGDNIQTKLDTLITSNAAIKTAVEILDNVVSGSEAQVDVVSLPALASGSNTIGTVNLSATDNAVLDAIATDAAALEVLQTAAEAHLGNIETSVQLLDDVVKAEDAAHSGGDKGIMGLTVRKDTATNLAGSDADYQPLITAAAGHLHVNDSLHHRVKDVSFMTTESISANSLSSTVLDTEGYTVVQIYGECTGGTTTSGSTELKIQGSSTSGGTYYAMGSLTASNYQSGRSMVNSAPANEGDAVGNRARFLKIYNNTSGTIQLTLRAVLSGFNTYI